MPNRFEESHPIYSDFLLVVAFAGMGHWLDGISCAGEPVSESNDIEKAAGSVGSGSPSLGGIFSFRQAYLESRRTKT